MDVRVDDHRHHGLAREAHARGAGGHVNIEAAAPACDDLRAVHDQRRVLDRGAPVAHDEPRAFERRDLRARRNRQTRKNAENKGCRNSGCIQSAHGSLLGLVICIRNLNKLFLTGAIAPKRRVVKKIA